MKSVPERIGDGNGFILGTTMMRIDLGVDLDPCAADMRKDTRWFCWRSYWEKIRNLWGNAFSVKVPYRMQMKGEWPLRWRRIEIIEENEMNNRIKSVCGGIIGERIHPND
jgi:hypothetical protein